MNILTFVATVLLSVAPSPCIKAPSVEKQVDKILAGMTQEQKIGQMIQLEVTQLAYNKYEFRSLIALGPEELGKIVQEKGLSSQYNVKEMFAGIKEGDLTGLYPFYFLSVALTAGEGFSLDPEKLETVFGEYRVSSILNMLGTEASDLELWQKTVAQLEDASMRYNGIPMIYGLDQVHGPTYIIGGTMYPQQLGLAATFDPGLVKELGEMNAYETRAAGVRWCFGPSMDLSVKPSWSRFYETWGEDPYLTSVMAGSYVQGLQGSDRDHLDAYHVVPCLKHYVGYGSPDNGIDRTPATITQEDLREKHFEPFRKAALDGVLSVMSNSSVVNGVPGVCNKQLLTDWLKDELQWDGVIVTDWADVQELSRLFKMSETTKESIALAVNAGIDMIMVPSELTYGPLLQELVEEGTVPQSRIDDAVRRIIRMKVRAGLFDKKPAKADYPLFGSVEFARKAYRAAVESEVLLKNDGVLPLPAGARILLCGPNANTMRGLSGGWTYSWQGSKVEKMSESYNTILEAFQARFGADNVLYEPGVEYDNDADWSVEKEPRIDAAVARAAEADYIVACVGENSYAETQGSTKDLNLSDNQKALVRALAATGKPVVLILNEGRPRIIRDIEPLAGAIVDVMLPSNYGGDALAALLAGDENFSGKLPFTYPAYPNAFTTYNYKVMEDRSTTPGIYNYENHASVQWWFGEGLSYTTFEYSGLSLDKDSFGSGDVLTFTVDVKNTGSRAGKETVMLYSSDDYATVMPDNRRLRAFRKIEIQPGETVRVTLEVPATDLAFVGRDGRWHLEKGSFTFLCGGKYVKAECTSDTVISRNLS